jgi:hypothetical protein
METFGDILKELWGVWKEMFSSFIKYIPVIFRFSLWVLCAIVILPCVFVAGNLYPKWVEWGEKF